MTITNKEIQDAADDERTTLTIQAIRTHLDNLEVEGRRFDEDMQRIESVYQLRRTLIQEGDPA